jgi:hypothetical protein
VTVLDDQLDEAARQRSGLIADRMPDGMWMVGFDAHLPPGWNRASTQVKFVLPLPYPAAQPDCFYADQDLRLARGAMPVNSGMQPLNNVPMLWFSWHLSAWNPQRDDVFTYVRFIESRLSDAR